MGLISAAIFLFVLVHNQISTDACETHVTNVEVACKNDEYYGDSSVSVSEDASNVMFSGKTTVIKALPENTQCSVTVSFKGDTGDWQPLPHQFPKGECCKLISENKMFEKLKDHPMFKDNCPAKEGTYEIDNMTFEKKCDDKAPKGDYKVTFSSETSDGKCLYATNTYVTIADS